MSTAYGYDAGSRLNSLSQDLAGTSGDQALSFTHNAAGQVLTRVASNMAYAPVMATVAKIYTPNGLNQLTAAGGTALTYDVLGNLSNDGARTYSYNAFRQLVSVTGANLYYDAVGRMRAVVSAGVATLFAYDGMDLIGEYNSAGAVLRRYVHGPAVDEPLVWYEGSGTTDRRWLVADDLGSVIAVTDGSGASTAINTYDEYGVPGASNTGRFQYTGQTWLSQAGLYHYKARAYNPQLGRFMQTDPIGYDDGMNMYAYVRNDPVNRVDPTGLGDEGFDAKLGGPCGIYPCTNSGDPTLVSRLNVWGVRLFTGEIPTQGPQQRPAGGGGGGSKSKGKTSDEKMCRAPNGLNLFNPTEDIHDYANKSQSAVPGAYPVMAHGSKDSVVGPDSQAIAPGELAGMIQDSFGYQPGQTVILGACNVGGSWYPQKLANKLGACVYSTAAKTWYSSKGGRFVSAGVKNTDGVKSRGSRVQWVRTCPKGK